MKSQLVLEFSGKMRGTFPENASATTADSLIWESPRLSVAAPFEDGRPKGSDRAFCRTVNGIVQVRFIDKAILDYTKFNPELRGFTLPTITAGLYGESAGIIGAVAFQQYKLVNDIAPELDFIDRWIVNRYTVNGNFGFQLFSSYANLMQNIFMRVTIVRPPAKLVSDATVFPAVKIDADCSGVLLGADLR